MCSSDLDAIFDTSSVLTLLFANWSGIAFSSFLKFSSPSTFRSIWYTAAPLAARLGLAPVVEADLREVFLGDWEGGELRIRAAAGDPLFPRIFSEQRWDVIPGAEPHDDFDTRTWRGFQRVVERHPDERIVVVAHGGVIGQLLHRVTGSSRFAFSGADNASISEVVAAPDRVVLRRFNDVTHLERLTPAR